MFDSVVVLVTFFLSVMWVVNTVVGVEVVVVGVGDVDEEEVERVEEVVEVVDVACFECSNEKCVMFMNVCKRYSSLLSLFFPIPLLLLLLALSSLFESCSLLIFL